MLWKTERRKISIQGENIGFNKAQIQQIGAIVASALSEHFDSFIADVAGMPKGDNDMPKKIRRPILVDGVTHWVCGNNEQEYAENIIRTVLGGAKAPDTSSTPHARSTNFRAYAENFMALYKRGKVRHTTLAGYEGYLKNHIYPFFGKMALEEISVDTVQAFLNAKADLSEHTVDELRRLLNSILQAACEAGILAKNPSKSRLIKNPAKGKKKVREAYTQKEFDEIRDAMARLPNLQDRRFLALALYTPARRGEILGFQMKDFDRETMRLSVRQNVTFITRKKEAALYGPNCKVGDAIIGKPKTEAGVRTMLIPPQLWDALELTQEELADKEAFLLPHRNDRYAPYTQSTLHRAWERITKQVGIDVFHGKSLHNFRHTFATRARREGMDLKTLQVLGGWSDQKTLENRYDHVQDEDEAIAMDQITKMYTRKPAG